MRLEIVLLPAPESPVNQSTKPLCTPVAQDLFEQNVDRALHTAVGGEVYAALLFGLLLPPPASCALGLSRLHGPGARIAADARIAPRIERMARHIVLANII